MPALRQSRRLKAHASARLQKAIAYSEYMHALHALHVLDAECFTDEGDVARPLGVLSESRFYVSNPPPEGGYEVAAVLTACGGTGREG